MKISLILVFVTFLAAQGVLFHFTSRPNEKIPVALLGIGAESTMDPKMYDMFLEDQVGTHSIPAQDNSDTISQLIGITFDLIPEGYVIGIDGRLVPGEKA